jgi:hypothetical protein
MQFKSFMEALKGNQHKLDKNKNGKVDAHDFKLLRKEESEETLEEAINADDYKVTSEPSQFGGHRAKIVHKEKGTTMHLSQHAYKSPEHAKEHAAAYLSAYEKKGPNAASEAAHAYAKNNKQHAVVKEAKMTDDDMAERERIVKGMKKDLAGFKARYGDRAKEVMYATATKQAMKEETVDEAVQKVDIPAYLRKQQGQPPLKLADLKRKDTISDKENLAKLRNEELDEAMINGREYASHGLMHPDHAAHAVHKVTGQSIDFYAHGTGDKVEGKVTKNDGKSVHIKDTKGKTHQFKVQRGLPKQQNEEKKTDVPFDGPYTKTKPAKNSDGTPQAPMSRARALAKDAMKKQMKEETDESEKNEMAQTQLHFIKYAAEEILDYIEMGGEIEEWYQNKLSKVQSEVESLHSYIEGESRRTGMKEEVDLEEQAPVAPTLDRKYIKGTPEHKAYKATKKPINGMPTNVKEEVELDEVEHKVLSYSNFISNLLEYETKDGVYRHKGTYGGSYNDPEGADDADDKKPKQQPAEKRGRGRPAGAKSGARKITGTSKLFK